MLVYFSVFFHAPFPKMRTETKDVKRNGDVGEKRWRDERRLEKKKGNGEKERDPSAGYDTKSTGC